MDLRVTRRIAAAALGLALLSCGADKAFAQAKNDQIEEIVVRATASRIPTNLASVPGSVTVLSSVEVEKQMEFGSDLGDMLGRLVPGLAANSGGSYSNFNQTLRGRKPLVFIDGVPASVSTRDGGHDSRLISAGAIGRVEVIRGATALYGLGAGGGLINYATKEPSEGPPLFTTEVALGSSLTHPGDSLVYSVDQSFVGKFDRISFVGSGYFESQGGLFDAEGRRVPPDPQKQGGISDTKSYDLFGKVGLDLTDKQRVFFSTNYYKTKQDTDYTSGLGVYGVTPTPAVKITTRDPRQQDLYTKNLVLTGRYTNDDVLGSAVNLQGYYSDYHTMFVFNPATFPPQGGVTTTGAQTQVLSDRFGFRIDVNTPFDIGTGASSVLWGADYSYENPYQSLTDGRYWVPPLTSRSAAPFAQLEMPVFDWLSARGGVRYDRTTFRVPNFTTLTVTAANPQGKAVTGGKVSFSKAVGNIGIVTKPIAQGTFQGTSFYAGFSQGYAIGDFGRALRASTASSVAAFGFKADVVNNYEVGVRYDDGTVKAQAAFFYVKSQYGSTFNAITYNLIRAPERIWGMELQVDAKFSDTWNGGATFSINDGRTQNTTTGIWSELDTSRIAPGKLTAFVEHTFANNWSMRAQYLYSMRQDKFQTNTAAYGRHSVEAYGLLDASISGKVGPGKLTFAVRNLMNERYYTPDSWRYVGSDTFTLGEGASGRLSYSVSY